MKRRRRRRHRARQSAKWPMSIIVALLLFVIAAPSTAAQGRAADTKVIFVSPAKSPDGTGFETRWNALPLYPVRDGADPIASSLLQK